MTSASLLELAQRAERASGADRELDGLIEVARDPMRETILYSEPGRFPQKAVRGPIKDLQIEGRYLADYISAPHFTASLDAAMALVPKGVTASVTWGGPASGALLWRGDPRKNGHFGEVKAATPALALTAAALRAIAQERSGG